MSPPNFELSQYPAFYKAIKAIALITFLMGAVTVVDYYLPPKSTSTPILHTQLERGDGTDRYNVQHFVLITKAGIIRLDPKYANDISEQMTLHIHRSQIFNALKAYRFYRNKNPVLEIEPDNIFGMDAFFAKILLLSIFTLLYANPKYWMIALSMVNVVIALIFSGIPKIYILVILVASATIAFIISLYAGTVRQRDT